MQELFVRFLTPCSSRAALYSATTAFALISLVTARHTSSRTLPRNTPTCDLCCARQKQPTGHGSKVTTCCFGRSDFVYIYTRNAEFYSKCVSLFSIQKCNKNYLKHLKCVKCFIFFFCIMEID